MKKIIVVYVPCNQEMSLEVPSSCCSKQLSVTHLHREKAGEVQAINTELTFKKIINISGNH